MQFLSEGWSRPLLEITGTLQNPGIHKKEMVKITNVFGDVKTGKQEGAVYQRHYGKQIRRVLQEKKNANTEVQLQQRARFKVGIDFAKGLTKAERDFLKLYMAETGITAPDGMPTTWYTYAKKIAMSVPRVVFETEAGSGGFGGTYAAWTYRKPITLTNSGSTLTDYQVLITLTTENFDYSNCKADGSDLRFAQTDGTTPLSYWIEDWNYNGTSKVWVKVNSVPNGENVCLYGYYGKATATSESNGTNTFVVFDNFEGTSVDTEKWNIESGTWSVANNELSIDAESGILNSVITEVGDIIIVCSMQRITNTGAAEVGIGSQNVTVNIRLFTGEKSELRDIPVGARNTIAFPHSINTWYKIKYQKVGSSFSAWIDDVLKHNNITATTTGSNTITIKSFSSAAKWKEVRARRYAASEPTPDLGAEEAGGNSKTLKAFTIHHPAIKSYEVLDTDIKEEGLSNLETHISTSASRANLEVGANTLKVVTLADQEYLFEIL